MRSLLDTNVVSELVNARPHRRVVEWINGAENDSLHLSALSIGEIRKGIERLAADDRRERLERWVAHDLPAWFGTRLLPIDWRVADRWGYLSATSPRTLPAVDSLLAATALVHDLCLVTRNVDDFQIPGLRVVNPWNGG